MELQELQCDILISRQFINQYDARVLILLEIVHMSNIILNETSPHPVPQTAIFDHVLT